jgi:hypothetical protein
VTKIALAHLIGLIEPDDIANMAVFLASDESRMVTGHVYPVDSGSPFPDADRLWTLPARPEPHRRGGYCSIELRRQVWPAHVLEHELQLGKQNSTD